MKAAGGGVLCFLFGDRWMGGWVGGWVGEGTYRWESTVLSIAWHSFSSGKSVRTLGGWVGGWVVWWGRGEQGGLNELLDVGGLRGWVGGWEDYLRR